MAIYSYSFGGSLIRSVGRSLGHSIPNPCESCPLLLVNFNLNFISFGIQFFSVLEKFIHKENGSTLEKKNDFNARGVQHFSFFFLFHQNAEIIFINEGLNQLIE